MKIDRYILAFYKFWYDFIIGDEWLLAASLMWSLLAAYSVNKNFFGDWYLLPILIALSLIYSLRRAQINYRQPGNKEITIMHPSLVYVGSWILMALVVILPYDFFYIRGGTFNISDVILPTAFNAVAILLITLATVPLLKKRPMLSTLLAGAATLVLVKYNRVHLVFTTRHLVEKSSGLSWAIICIASLFLVVLVLYGTIVISKKASTD